MTNTTLLQLHMLWPERQQCHQEYLAPPEGYVLRSFTPDDAQGYFRLMETAGFCDWNRETLQPWLDRVLPGGFFLLEHAASGDPVATTMATHNPSEVHTFGAELGWVAGDPRHAGKGIGLVVVANATRRMVEAGYSRIYLKTDDWRLPAIKTYLRLGYVPFLYAPDMSERWKAICRQLGWSYAVEEWPRAAGLAQLPTTPDLEPERPDSDRVDRYAFRYQWHPHRPHRGYSCTGDVDTFGDESLYRPSSLGTADVEPASVVAGDEAPLTLSFHVGEAGLAQGDVVTYVIRGQEPLGRGERVFKVEGPPDVALEAVRWGFCVRSRHLVDGDKVRLVAPAFTWTPLAGRREAKVVIRRAAGGPEQRLPEPVVIRVLPRPVCAIEATLPGSHKPGEPMIAHITVRDEYDNRVRDGGAVSIVAATNVHPAALANGVARITVPSSPLDVTRVLVQRKALPDSWSNPSVLSTDRQVYFGDLHCHDFMSEAEGYTDQVYKWAIEDRRLDFVSVVPQTHGWHDNETWTVVKYMNERFLDEGSFVTFLGFEWQHTGYGDKVIHYLGGDQPYLPVDDRRYRTPARLYKSLSACDALVIAHHPCYPAGDWCSSTDYGAIDTRFEPLVELWSMHGSSEGYDPDDRPLILRDPARYVYSALRRGVRLGFVAGSDTHSARPGGSAKEPRPYWGGMAAVWADSLSRRSVFEALRARRTYALTRARIVLKMTLNGAWMGSEIPLTDEARIQIDAWAPSVVQKVEILRNTVPIHTAIQTRDEVHIQFSEVVAKPCFYHCRVTLADGNLAVCSPVWVG